MPKDKEEKTRRNRLRNTKVMEEANKKNMEGENDKMATKRNIAHHLVLFLLWIW